MRTGWDAIHVFSSNIELLLTEAVAPFLETMNEFLQHGFWERHYAGGAHVRVRVLSVPRHREMVLATLRERLTQWVAHNPSPGVDDYSPARAARLLREEGVDPATEDLTYRVNALADAVYPEKGKPFASERAREISEDFRRRRGPLAIQLMQERESRRDLLLQFFFLLALQNGGGSYVRGSVSYKSHWEGFYSVFPEDAFLRRVAKSYEEHRDHLSSVAEALRRQWQENRPFDHPLLGQWRELLREFATLVTAALESGHPLIGSIPDGPVFAAHRAQLAKSIRRPSVFVEALWSDDRFMTSLADDILFQRPRALVNLLYELLATLGVTPLEKMVFCHHAFRTVEDLHGTLLEEQLKINMTAVIERHRQRTTDA